MIEFHSLALYVLPPLQICAYRTIYTSTLHLEYLYTSTIGLMETSVCVMQENETNELPAAVCPPLRRNECRV
jgi:hypothetical protein